LVTARRVAIAAATNRRQCASTIGSRASCGWREIRNSDVWLARRNSVRIASRENNRRSALSGL
jgi:hypothetical protein